MTRTMGTRSPVIRLVSSREPRARSSIRQTPTVARARASSASRAIVGIGGKKLCASIRSVERR